MNLYKKPQREAYPGSIVKSLLKPLAKIGWSIALVLWANLATAQTITPITWNVVGLDSNNVSVGPNVFPVGVRICNTSGVAKNAGDWKAQFNWVTTSVYITRTSTQQLSLPALAINACADIFHEITVTRDSAAYGQRAQYNIEVVNSSNASLSPAVKTPTNREISLESRRRW